MPVKKTLIVTPEEKKLIKSKYEKSETELEKDVEDIKEWLKKQPHLPQNEDDYRIRNMLLLNKCNPEKTKRKLNFYYSVKHIVPEFFENREPLSPAAATFFENVVFLPLPRLTPECHRVYIYHLLNDDSSKFDMTTYFKLFFCICDLRTMYDFALGDHFIIDLEHVQFGHIIQFSPVMLKKAHTILQNAYSDRIKGIHFIHVPSYARIVINLVRAVMSEKLANRVRVHKDFESLHKILPKEILPFEYEGKAGHMNDLNDDWKKYLCSKNDWIKRIGDIKSDESKRIGKPLDSNLFGMCRLFRKINVD